MSKVLTFKYKKSNDEVTLREVVVINTASHNNLCVEIDSLKEEEKERFTITVSEIQTRHKEELRKCIFVNWGLQYKDFSQEKMEIILAELGNRAGLLGAAALPLESR